MQKKKFTSLLLRMGTSVKWMTPNIFLHLVHKQDFGSHSEQEDVLAYIQDVIHFTYILSARNSRRSPKLVFSFCGQRRQTPTKGVLAYPKYPTSAGMDPFLSNNSREPRGSV